MWVRKGGLLRFRMNEAIKKQLQRLPFYSPDDNVLVTNISELFPDDNELHVNYSSALLKADGLGTFISFILKPELKVSDDMFINVDEPHRRQGVAKDLLFAHKTICEQAEITVSRFPKNQNDNPNFWKKQGYALDGDYYTKRIGAD